MIQALGGTVKEEIIQMLQRLPNDCTLEDILYHLHVRQMVEQGIRDVEEGRVHTQEEVERMSAQWLKSSGQTQP